MTGKCKTFLSAVLITLVFGIFVAGVFAVEKPTTLRKTCVTKECHTDYGQKKHVHGPVALGDCKTCHEPGDPKKHTWQLEREGTDLCEFCHLKQQAGKNIHEPLKSSDCMQCHDPHASDNRFLIPGKSVAGLCRDCHETATDLEFPHGPVAVGECTVCHDSHSSDHEALLTAEPAELCLSCHIVTKRELADFEFVHEPVEEGCRECHDPHGADNAMMLAATVPQMCYRCHEDIKKVARAATYNHTIVTQEGGCLGCHTPHASTVEYGLRDNPMGLCMSCHDKPVRISKDEVLPAFTEEIENKQFLHGPVAQKDCKGCHSSHGSDHFRLLVKQYPPMFYAPFSPEAYELCFSCHKETLVLEEKTLKLTDFRNGDVNLHYLHVNKPQRGRTCRSCHSTHASNQANHVRESVPYGMWDLPIQFEKTETGGRCEPGCHVPYSYDRQNPVDYSRPEASPTSGEGDSRKGEDSEPARAVEKK